MDLPISVWTHHSSGYVLLGCNTDYIPSWPSSSESPLPRTDGTWGPHDYTLIPQPYDPQAPYLAWSPRRTHPAQSVRSQHIMDYQLTRQDYRPHPHSYVLGGLKKDIHAAFVREVCNLEQTFDESVRAAHRLNPLVQAPDNALERMRAALSHLNLSDIYYRDCMEGVETLRRNTREVLAFLLWALSPHSAPYPRLQYAVRGSIAPDAGIYTALYIRQVPAWLVVPHSGPDPCTFVSCRPLHEMCTLQSWRQVPTADRTDIDSDQVSPGEYRLLHTKPLWYYPPVVNEPADFERAARGYATRTDTYNADKRQNRDLLFMQRAGTQSGILHALHC